MYIVDLAKRLATKENAPILIYLVLNVLLTGGILQLFTVGTVPYWKCLLVGIVLYAISVLIALSPIGEFVIRLQTGCKRIKRKDQIDFLEPVFREVYDRSKLVDPSLPDDIRLYINTDEAPNAFATGRKTVCVTKGLLQLPPENVKAIIGHEMGHISHKDSDIILLFTVGNMFVNGFIIIVRAFASMIKFTFSLVGMIAGGVEGAMFSMLNAIGDLVIACTAGLIVKLWTKLGLFLCMKSSRGNEYLADEFSFNLGYGTQLCGFLDAIEGSKPEGLFATLASSHPDSGDRIARLQELGVQYSTT